MSKCVFNYFSGKKERGHLANELFSFPCSTVWEIRKDCWKEGVRIIVSEFCKENVCVCYEYVCRKVRIAFDGSCEVSWHVVVAICHCDVSP